MSDFLARLAARAVGTAAIVVPRPAAAFAPIADLATPEPVTNDTTARARHSRATAPEQTSSPAAEPAREFAVSSRPMHAPPVVALDENVPAPAAFFAAEILPPQEPLPSGRNAERTDPDRRTLDRPAGGNAPPAPPGNTGACAPAPRVEPQVPTGSTVARAWDGGMAGRSPASRRDPPAMTPTVHISIGRVEVRANQVTNDSPRTPRKSESAQQLSLGDYLRRGGGDRR